MKLDSWRSSISTSADRYATVALDCTREHPDDVDALKLRWKTARGQLRGDGAPADLLDLMEQRLREPDGRGGRIGRLLIGGVRDDSAELVADIGLPEPPEPAVTRWSPVPDVTALVRAGGRHPRHLRVLVDRAGGTVTPYGLLGRRGDTEQIAGEHDVLHKVRAGDASQQRLQRRAEDSWDHNAAAVASRVEELAREQRPAAVLVAGDERAVRALCERLSVDTRRMVTVVRGDLHDGAARSALDAVVAAHVESALADFLEEEGRQDRAVQGRSGVGGAIRRGQAQQILLLDPPPAHGVVRVGPDGLPTEDGTGEPVDAMLAFTVGAMVTGADVTLVPDSVQLTDGAGAVLRWADSSTPRDLAPSMPGKGGPQGSHR